MRFCGGGAGRLGKAAPRERMGTPACAASDAPNSVAPHKSAAAMGRAEQRRGFMVFLFLAAGKPRMSRVHILRQPAPPRVLPAAPFQHSVCAGGQEGETVARESGREIQRTWV